MEDEKKLQELIDKIDLTTTVSDGVVPVPQAVVPQIGIPSGGVQPTIASFGACTVRSLSPQQSQNLLDNAFGFTGTGFTDRSEASLKKDSSPTVVNNVYNFKSEDSTKFMSVDELAEISG